MSCALTSDYSQASCGDLFGGVPTIFLIEKANIISVTVTSDVVTSILKTVPFKFRKYELKQGTAQGKETKTVNKENGTSSTKQTVTFSQQGLSAALRTELEIICQNLLTVVVLDENGTGWLYGKDKGMRVTTVDADTGKALSDLNGYMINLEAEEKYFAYPIDSNTLSLLTVIDD
jgi:hypothetical protein